MLSWERCATNRANRSAYWVQHRACAAVLFITKLFRAAEVVLLPGLLESSGPRCCCPWYLIHGLVKTNGRGFGGGTGFRGLFRSYLLHLVFVNLPAEFDVQFFGLKLRTRRFLVRAQFVEHTNNCNLVDIQGASDSGARPVKVHFLREVLLAQAKLEQNGSSGLIINCELVDEIRTGVNWRAIPLFPEGAVEIAVFRLRLN